MKHPKKVLSVFTLAMINVALIVSLRGLPLMAENGLASIFFFLFAALFFLIPVSFVSAELATGWPQTGGVFIWVKEAFGARCGFLAIWLQWIQNVIWYPTVLSFTAATIAYLFNPTLAENKWYNMVMILAIYWGATLLNFRGLKLSGWITTVSVICGTLIPGALIIALGCTWLISGNPSQVTFSLANTIPNFSHFNTITFLAGVLLLFAGMEVSAAHAQEVKNPQRDYPRAILLATLIALVVFILGTLAITIVVPQTELSLTAGLLQAFTAFFDAYHIGALVPLLALLIAFGTVGQIITWIVGPSKGLYATSKQGDLPPVLKTVNNRHVPTHILVLQGVIVTALSLVFLFMPNVSASYWILTALTAQLYLIMYILLFLAALRLRYTQPHVRRAFRIPGGNVGMWIVSLIGITGAAFAIFIGFFPPAQLKAASPTFYVTFLLGGIATMIAAPLAIYALRKPSWKNQQI